MIGYIRSNKKVGIRNHIIIMSAADNVNPLSRKISKKNKGSIFVSASYGRGQLGQDHENYLNAMSGIIDNPNVYKTILLSMDGDSADWIINKSKRKKDIHKITLMESKSVNHCIREAIDVFKLFKKNIKNIKKKKFNLSDLILGLECGGSDTTSGLIANPSLGVFVDKLIAKKGSAIFSEPVECLGGEENLIKRCKNKIIKQKILSVVNKYAKIASDNGVNLTGLNPTPDNIRGGLSTIEEKSLGAISKSGTGIISGVLDFGERIEKKGLYLLDAPAAAVENLTSLAVSGCQLIVFTTGGGNPVGNPISPTIKITANKNTYEKFKDLIDISEILESINYKKGSLKIENKIINVIKGNKTASEKNDYLELNISRFGPSIWQ